MIYNLIDFCVWFSRNSCKVVGVLSLFLPLRLAAILSELLLLPYSSKCNPCIVDERHCQGDDEIIMRKMIDDEWVQLGIEMQVITVWFIRCCFDRLHHINFALNSHIACYLPAEKHPSYSLSATNTRSQDHKGYDKKVSNYPQWNWLHFPEYCSEILRKPFDCSSTCPLCLPFLPR